MGSSLYHVHVVSVDAETSTVVFRVVVVHPDAGPVPPGKCFAFSIVMDPVIGWEYGSKLKNCALAGEFDVDDYLDTRRVAKNVGGFVADCTEQERSDPPEYGAENYEAFWEEGGPEAYAVLSVTMTHPGWMEHLRPGMSYETAAYSGGDGDPWEDEPRVPGDMVTVISDNAMDGMYTVPKTSERFTRMLKADELPGVSGLILPSVGAKHYTTTLLFDTSSPDALKHALTAHIGQPILIETHDGFRDTVVGCVVKVEDERFSVLTAPERGGYTSNQTFGYDTSFKRIGRAFKATRVRREEE